MCSYIACSGLGNGYRYKSHKKSCWDEGLFLCARFEYESCSPLCLPSLLTSIYSSLAALLLHRQRQAELFVRFPCLEKLWLDENQLTDMTTFAVLAGLKRFVCVCVCACARALRLCMCMCVCAHACECVRCACACALCACHEWV